MGIETRRRIIMERGKLKAIMVDNRKTDLLVLGEYVLQGKFGMSVDTFDNLVEGLEYLQLHAHEIDLFLCDFHLGDQDESMEDVIQSIIRCQKEYPDISFFIISSYFERKGVGDLLDEYVDQVFIIPKLNFIDQIEEFVKSKRR